MKVISASSLGDNQCPVTLWVYTHIVPSNTYYLRIITNEEHKVNYVVNCYRMQQIKADVFCHIFIQYIAFFAEVSYNKSRNVSICETFQMSSTAIIFITTCFVMYISTYVESKYNVMIHFMLRLYLTQLVA